MAEVKVINAEENKVVTDQGERTYDYLVIATGCSTNYFGNEQLERFCLPMKSTQESIAIRNEILLSFEKYVSAPPAEKDAILNLVIVGAGPTGVELAGAFAEMKNFILAGGHPTISQLHIARCVCRRAERCCVRLLEASPLDPIIIQYLNRLSDYLFVLARYTGMQLGAQEIPWKARK